MELTVQQILCHLLRGGSGIGFSRSADHRLNASNLHQPADSLGIQRLFRLPAQMQG
ncbi:hypothetical protein SAMN04487895_102229 [Paenibacillus sophorae]|uniref:Uncharacterized protein n=1 Tax=Paenibacillus sophorae TaxID=1333845 RepID=A0A1H8IKT5_9BACL|nr:hypothetical protein [Paenibacillus sophorae]SEN68952.1 hypothetical protein SAMN04487895_102229 [Paenibacillus sophorae]